MCVLFRESQSPSSRIEDDARLLFSAQSQCINDLLSRSLWAEGPFIFKCVCFVAAVWAYVCARAHWRQMCELINFHSERRRRQRRRRRWPGDSISISTLRHPLLSPLSRSYLSTPSVFFIPSLLPPLPIESLLAHWLGFLPCLACQLCRWCVLAAVSANVVLECPKSSSNSSSGWLCRIQFSSVPLSHYFPLIGVLSSFLLFCCFCCSCPDHANHRCLDAQFCVCVCWGLRINQREYSLCAILFFILLLAFVCAAEHWQDTSSPSLVEHEHTFIHSFTHSFFDDIFMQV